MNMYAIFALLLIGFERARATPLPRQSVPITASLSHVVPNDASDVVDNGYPAFAMSSHSFQEYAGSAASPNTFSANLIQAISNRTGAPVHVRIGGTSGDFSRYASNQDVALKLPADAKAGEIPKGMTMGPSWYEGFNNFQGVKWTYMVHFAELDGLDNSMADMQQALKHIGANLEALEIGNEIDLYPIR